MTTAGDDSLPPAVRDLIDGYVAGLVAAAPAPTEEQLVELRRWFGPRRDTQRRHTDAA